MSHGIDFEFSFSKNPQPGRRAAGDPFKIVVIGDFSGAGYRAPESAPDPAPPTLGLHRVRIDQFDVLLSTIRPAVSLEVAHGQARSLAALEFGAMDDFHPDRLFGRVEVVDSLARLRDRLTDPATYPEAARELKEQGMAAVEAETRGQEEPAEPASTAEEGDKAEGGMFDRLLGQDTAVRSGDDGGQASRAASRVDNIIKAIVQPHIAPGVDAQQPQLLSSVDDALTEVLRQVLRDPGFRALEASWRSLYWLASNLDLDEDLQIYVLDCDRERLGADLGESAADPTNSVLYRTLNREGAGTLGGTAWSLVIGDFEFGRSCEDLSLLASLGAVCALSGAPLIAGGNPALLGCPGFGRQPDARMWSDADPELAECWQTLRKSSLAAWVGLALPRLLLRLPYGDKGESVERLDFEELAPRPDHEHFLWSHGAFGCALLLGESFLENEWELEPGDRLDLDDIPLAIYDDGTGQAIMPGAEAYIDENTAARIAGLGLMPWLSYRNRNSVRLFRFQSIADPPAALRGSW